MDLGKANQDVFSATLLELGRKNRELGNSPKTLHASFAETLSLRGMSSSTSTPASSVVDEADRSRYPRG